jgi:uncharacterized membrane protein YdjX (TVP38/TMEM64 family)
VIDAADGLDGAAVAGSGDDIAPECVVEAPSLGKVAGFLGFAAVCIALAVIAGSMGWFSRAHLEDWRGWIAGFGGWGPVVFVGVTAAAVAVGVPRTFFATAGGALFGFVSGALLSQFGSLIGSVITFVVGRALGRRTVGPWVTARFPRSRAVFDTVKRHGFAANVLLRWAPVGHSFTTSLLMAVSHVKSRDFVLGTFVGLLPYSVICALLGSAAKGEDTVMRIASAVGGVVVLTVFVGWWVRRRRRTRAAHSAGPAS